MKKVIPLKTTATHNVGQKFADFRETINSLCDAVKELQQQVNKPVTTTKEQPKFTSAEYHIICNAVAKCHGDKHEVFQINRKMNQLVEN
jgi:hypothetical protein